MIWFLIATSFIVSIDSFVCGFSLSILNSKKFHIILGISLVVLLLCTLTNYLALFFHGFLNEKTASLGGLILIVMGLYNLFKKKKEKNEKQLGILKQSILSGFAVGSDGAVANLSLSLMGYNAFFVPLTITAMHFLMISFGTYLANTSFIKKFAKIEWLSPFILILLGTYKLLGLFI